MSALHPSRRKFITKLLRVAVPKLLQRAGRLLFITAHITAMRFLLGQSVSHLNLLHGFRHISMPKGKFSIDTRPFKINVVDDSSLTIYPKSKTVKSSFLFSSQNPVQDRATQLFKNWYPSIICNMTPLQGN